MFPTQDQDPQAQAGPAPQAPPPQQGSPNGAEAFAQIVQQLQQAAAQQPQDGNPSGADTSPASNPVFQQLLQRSQETQQDAMERLKRQYYGLKDGEAEPTKGNKAKMKIVEVLRALTQNGYQSPRERMQNIVNQQFPAETQRLGVGTAAVGTEIRQQIAQDKIDQQQRALTALNDREKAKLDEKTKRDQELNVARTNLNNIRQQMANSAGDVRTQQALLEKKKGLILDYKLAHPDIKPGQLYDDLLPEGASSEDKLQLWTMVHAASSPFAAIGNTSTQTVDPNTGVTHNTSQKNFVNPQAIQALRNLFSGGQGAPAGQAPQGQPNPPSAPGAPSASPVAQPGQQPPPGGAAAVIPSDRTGNTPNIIDTMDPRNQVRAPIGKTVFNDRAAAAKDTAKTIDKIRAFEMQAGGGADNMINSIVTGKAKNFQGALEGNPFMVDMRKMFGNVSSQEAMQQLQNLDTLYGKLGANIRGRFTVPEIAGHLRTQGALTSTPENALTAITALKLQANMQRLFEHGDISEKDIPVLNTLVRNEMNRVQGAVKNISPADRARMLAGGAAPDELRIKSVEQLLQERKTAADQHALPQTAGPTLDDVHAEIARRAAAKKN